MKDREREKELLSEIPGAGDSARVLAMTERDEFLGWTAVETDKGVLRILKLWASDYDFQEKPQGETVFILDTLVRSAASYGETFGAAFIETAFPDFFDFLKKRGFDSDQDHAFTPMSTIVKYK